MLKRIADIQLYMGLTAEVGDCYAAKKFLDDNGIKFAPYMYTDESQHQGNFDAISSWKLAGAPEVVDKFPFLIYTEIHDELEPSQYPRKMLYGLEALTGSDIVDLYKIGR